MKAPDILRKSLDKWFWRCRISRYRLDNTPWFRNAPKISYVRNDMGVFERIWEGACDQPFDVWCDENMPGRWRPGWDTIRQQYVVLFKHEEDLIHFKLYWSEELAAASRAKGA